MADTTRTPKWQKFGALLRKYRLQASNPPLSQEGLADLLGEKTPGYVYSSKSISNWERGTYKPDTRENAIELVKIFVAVKGIETPQEAIDFIYAGSYPHLTPEEIEAIFGIKEQQEEISEVSDSEITDNNTGKPDPSGSYQSTNTNGINAFGGDISHEDKDSANQIPLPEKPLHIFTNIWYASHRMGFFEFYNPILGVLRIYTDRVEYESGNKFDNGTLSEGQYHLVITHSQAHSAVHTQHTGNINNNWVRIEFTQQAPKEAWFAEASKGLGWSNLVGGSHDLYQVVAKWYAQTL